MHTAKRKRLGITQGQSMIGKVAVMGLLERHTKDDGRAHVGLSRDREPQDAPPEAASSRAR